MRGRHAYCLQNWDAEPFVARATPNVSRPASLRPQEVFWITDTHSIPAGYRAYISTSGWRDGAGTIGRPSFPQLEVPPSFDPLRDGDIVRIVPRRGEISVLYRSGSPHNAVFLTGRCNCNCLTCPQPACPTDTVNWQQVWLDAIPLMDHSTISLGITGGEPTVEPNALLAVLQACKRSLPKTALHLLSNGRMFNYLTFCQSVQDTANSDLMVGVSLYSDVPYVHNFMVQSPGAFDQSIRGLINMKRCGLRVEIRVVLCRQTTERLPQLARFIARNLCFADHVAFMGLELVGQAKRNEDALWVVPGTYQTALSSAVDQMTCHHIPVSVYNQPLCLLTKEVRPFARKSITDWKAEFYGVCRQCSLREECGGVFWSAKEKLATYVRPM